MTKLTQLSDESLHDETLKLAREERRLAIEVLHHLREIERRMLHAKRGHPGLLEYCVTELGYTRSAAQRRIDSMRVLRHVPSVEAKLADGSLSLSHLSDAQSFFRKEEIRDPVMKMEILDQLVGKSVVEAQRKLMTLTDQPERHIPERTRVVSAELTEVRFVVDQGTLAEIEELKALLSHSCPGMGVKEALQYGLKLALAKHRIKPPRPRTAESAAPDKSERVGLVPTSVPTKEGAAASSAIEASLRRQVYHRDRGCCTYVDPVTGRACGSMRFLEIDHVLPRSLGGKNALENLRLRCRAHNQLAAVEVLGRETMKAFLPALRRQ